MWGATQPQVISFSKAPLLGSDTSYTSEKNSDSGPPAPLPGLRARSPRRSAAPPLPLSNVIVRAVLTGPPGGCASERRDGIAARVRD
jgi:hypothetical protein